MQSARRYVPHVLGIGGLIAKLQAHELRYVVLRWFENLPDLPAGEDLDLLVADASLAGVHALLDEGPGIQPCDVYSVTGLPGAEYRRLPYFAPHLASTLLSQSCTHASGAQVPNPKHHFLSLAYHALYHKGTRSGLPMRGDRASHDKHPSHAAGRPEHDYPAILRSLADQIGARVSLTVEDLDEYLHAEGFRPPRDMLVRLAKRNSLVRCLLERDAQEGGDAGLAVFLVRQAAVDRGDLPTLTQLIEHEGFQILKTNLLSAEESHRVARTIRGGNWGRGPWPACAGDPAAVIIAYDAEPIPVSRRTKKRYPELTNARLLCKSKLRDAVNHSLPREQHINALHSSDNGLEARDYIQLIMPEALPDIEAQIARIKERFHTDEPVVFQLSNYRRRAKTEVIRFGSQLAVKKTFKAHQRSCCQREAWAMAQLSQSIQAIPPLLAADSRSVTYPYYEDVLRFRRSSGRLLPLAVAKQAIAALNAVYDAGYALIDAHPENVIVDRQHGLKLIDFEFLHQYEHKPSRFEDCYDVAGCPADFSGSQPDGGAKCYSRHWQPYIGLSLHSLLNDPVWLQHVKRSLYWIAASPRLMPRRLREVAVMGWNQLVRRKAAQPPLPLPTSKPITRPSARRSTAA